MLRTTISFALLCVVCHASVAAEAPPTSAIGWPWARASAPLAVSNTPHPAVARITVIERDGIAFGSGTLVDIEGEQGLVITNWHVVRDAAGEITAQFPDGFRSQAKVLQVDRDWDLAALTIWKPKVAPVRLATAAPQPGEALTIAGYGSGDFRAATARCTQYVSPGKNLPFEMVEVGAEARQGDSGGPILNQRGEVAGVLFGAGGGTTSGSYVGRVRTFLAGVSPRLADPNYVPPSQAQLASTNPFINPDGAVRLVRESAAATKPSSTPPPLVPIASTTAARDDDWQSAGAHPSITPQDAPGEVAQRPIFTASAEPLGNRGQVRATQITFGSLPDQLEAPAPSSILADVAEEQLPLWSRPLPDQRPTITAGDTQHPLGPANPNESARAEQHDSAELVQSLLGPTWFDQGKSLFAILGIVTVLYRLLSKSEAES